MSNTEELLATLSAEERKIALTILGQIANNGESALYYQFKWSDFKEKPVDIITFVKDPRYLGKAWHTPDGRCKLFPYWEKKLKELFPDEISTSVNTAIFSGARGLGKSEIAITCALYLMHRLMCLKDPHLFLNLKATEQVAFAFMNITEALAYDIGVTKFQNTVQMSPWFMERGTMSGKSTPVWNPPSFIKIIVGSQSRHVIGQAIYFAFFDEISFIANQDVEMQKKRALDMIDTAIGGMKTRFTTNGKNPTLLVLASSKRSEKSFLETHIKKKAETDKENTLIVDEPVWNVRPASEYSGIRFKVALGNRFLVSEVIQDDELIPSYIEKGYTILLVPVEYRAQFLEDIDRALCDYAGVSSSELSTYISGARLNDIKTDSYENPFVQEIIDVGVDDEMQYYNFFDMSKVDKNMITKPLFIHLDMSISGDKTGIAGVWQKDIKPVADENLAASEIRCQLAFSVSIRAPKGHQISFEKHRQFIYWLKSQGFKISGISSDTYQNADLAQQLKAKKFEYSIISVDRVNSEHICEPYHALKGAIYEKRLIMYEDRCSLLTQELVALERNNTNGKIDHPLNGSKDVADAVCGAFFNACQHADSFGYDYGETLDVIQEVSSSQAGSAVQQQIMVDFEDVLRQLHQKDTTYNKQQHALEQDNSAMYFADGIIVL